MPERRTDKLAKFRQAVQDGRVDETLDEAYDALIDAAGEDLSLVSEVGALRLLLHRAMALDALDGDAYETGSLIAELVVDITAAMRAQRQISGGATDDLAAAVDRVLGDLGVGLDGD